jgi:hypothetical protein
LLKERFVSMRSDTGTEYYDLTKLKKLFKEPHARGVLEKMKQCIRDILAELTFLYTLRSPTALPVGEPEKEQIRRALCAFSGKVL